MRAYWASFSEVADHDAFRVSTQVMRDGCSLQIYECGPPGGAPCLILPPPGVPFLVLARLALALGRDQRVISWETRGASFVPGGHGYHSSSIEDFALDIGEIAAAKNLTKVSVITWCESFNLLPLLRSHTALELHGVINISPAVYDRRHSTAVSAANATFLDAMTGSDLAGARDYYDTWQFLREMMQTSLEAEEGTVARLLALPMNDFESALHFAVICRHFQERANRKKSLHAATALDALFIHCQDDKVLNYKGTLAFFNQLKGGRLSLHRTGGHACVYMQADALGREISCFLQSR